MIELSADLEMFFKERLTSCLEEHSVRLQTETEFYLVDLMVRYAKAGTREALQQTFVERMLSASEARGKAQLAQFRALGDAALYVSGFFADSLKRRGVKRSYVVTVGHRAYNTAGSLAPRSRRAATYLELADAFGALADALDDLRESTTLRTPQDIVRLYDRWRETHNPKLAARLKEEGVFPVAGKHETVH